VVERNRSESATSLLIHSVLVMHTDSVVGYDEHDADLRRTIFDETVFTTRRDDERVFADRERQRQFAELREIEVEHELLR
jgi:hypothetical protein